MTRIDFKFLFEPIDPLVMSAGTAARLVDDWNRAGRPEDVFHFLATTSPWCDMPVYVFRNTFEAMKGPFP